MIDAVIDDIEVEIRCQRIHGIDRVFSTSMDWLHAERPSEGALAYSVEILFFSIIESAYAMSANRWMSEPDCSARTTCGR
jgi:hypothetical protein